MAAEIVITKAAGIATTLAAEARGDIVVAVGGDGTINEIVNGLDPSTKELGIIPSGSGNDLVTALGIPKQSERALDVVTRRRLRFIDLGRLSWSNDEDYKHRLFVNGIGFGFDAVVAQRVSSISYGSGLFVYGVAVIQSLFSYVPWKITGRIDADPFEANCLLFAIGNGSSAGGGFLLTPKATLDDQLFDCCILEARGILEIVKLMPKAIKGVHELRDGARHLRGKQIEVNCPTGIPIHADGQVLGSGVTHATINVIPNGLRVIA